MIKEEEEEEDEELIEDEIDEDIGDSRSIEDDCETNRRWGITK